MFDLCSGLGGAGAAFRDRGWEVVTVDIDPKFNPDFVHDLRSWSWSGRKPDFIWASPPCDEFSREFMPWHRTGEVVDVSLVGAVLRIVAECRPRFWILENTKGAQWWLGRAPLHIGPFYLWGWYPPIKCDLQYRAKASYSSSDAEKRAEIPYSLSLAVCTAIERRLESEGR